MAHYLMTDPAGFEVRYRINPWMDPAAWAVDPEASSRAAGQAWRSLKAALEAEGAWVEVMAPTPGLPDAVFPANAAVVLDGVALLARFRHRERRGEEPAFEAAFERLRRAGVVRRLERLPDGCFQEGAGDCVWDAGRALFWAGFGPRSDPASLPVIERVFGQPVAGLELASERFYHLDTCFCVLPGGEILYYRPGFTASALRTIESRVAPELRLEAAAEEAAAFCVNAVCIGRAVVMAKAPATLRRRLEGRGYKVVEVDLSPFMLSGGGAYCMTLRLDRRSRPAPASLRLEAAGASG